MGKWSLRNQNENMLGNLLFSWPLFVYKLLPKNEDENNFFHFCLQVGVVMVGLVFSLTAHRVCIFQLDAFISRYLEADFYEII